MKDNQRPFLLGCFNTHAFNEKRKEKDPCEQF